MGDYASPRDPVTEDFEKHFTENYWKMRPIYVHDGEEYISERTFLEIENLPAEKEGWRIVNEVVYEDKLYVKVTRTRTGKNLRDIEKWMLAEDYGEIEPAKLAFYVYRYGLYFYDRRWQFVNDYIHLLTTLEPKRDEVVNLTQTSSDSDGTVDTEFKDDGSGESEYEE